MTGTPRGSFELKFLVVGAQKSGTTSLHRYLQRHPDLYLPSGKETSFFHECEDPLGQSASYERYFSEAPVGAVCGEVSPQYMFSEDVPAKIYRYNPSVRIIMILRHPVDRAFSHYLMNRRRGLEQRDFGEVARSFIHSRPSDLAPVEDYFAYGQYGRILQGYLQSFPEEQILVVTSQALDSNRLQTLGAVQRHIGVREVLQLEDVSTRHHESGNSRLRSYYRIKQSLASMPRPIKQVAIRAVGASRLREFLYKVETEWNVKTDKDDDIEPELRAKICMAFASDYHLLRSLSGIDDVWPDLVQDDRSRGSDE